MKTCARKILKSAACLFVALAAIASCKPDIVPEDDKNEPGDGPGTEDKEDITAMVDSVENVLYRQVRAMQLVLTDADVLVSSCKATENAGQYEITLSTGASFSIYTDEADIFSDVLSFYFAESGSTYWALCDGEGNSAPVKDSEGAMLDMKESVDVKVLDKKITLKSKDFSCELGYSVDESLQMFHCSPHFDSNGQVYAVTFGFGDGKSKLVYVADYQGVYFYLPGDESKTAASELYVNTEGKAKVAVELLADVDWMPVVDNGWTASVSKEDGVTYVVLQAPAEGVSEDLVLKAVSNTDHVFCSIALTFEQFHSFAVSVTDAVIVPATGLGPFAYGISEFSDFEEEAVRALAEKLIAGEASPSVGNGVSDTSVSKAFADILGSDLDSEARYVLWAYADGVLRQMEFGEIGVDMEILKTSLLDAEVKVVVSGANSIFGGVIEKSDDMMSSIIYQVANKLYDPILTGTRFEYSGLASDFPYAGAEKSGLRPATEYVIWVVPAVDGEYEYSEKDVITMEFTTNDVVAGGSLELTCSDPVVSTSSISFQLSCSGAKMIYYAYLKADGGNRYSSDQVSDAAKFEQIVTEDSDFRVGDYVSVIGDKVEAVGKNFNDEAATEYWLFAVAVDDDGKYGKVHCVSAKTLKLAYDSGISLTVDAYDVTARSATFKVTSEGGNLSEYIYWVGRDADPFWANSSFCAGTKKGAQKYMALNPDDENIEKTMRKYGQLSDDGTITINDMTMETRYVFVILEKGEQYYSPVGYKSVTTLAADLGDIVREGTDKWNAAKARIYFDWHKDRFEQPPHLMATYAFDITCPTEFTTYVMCASEGYFSGMGLLKVEHHMIELESYASRRVDKDHTVYDASGNMIQEPDYYKDGVLKEGQLMSVNDFYVHGVPIEGTVTYFAKDTHDEHNCPSWNGAGCDNYTRALEKIEYYGSDAPWKIRAANFGLKDKEADDWAAALQKAYSEYYNNAKPRLYINEGAPLTMINPYGTGLNEDGVVPDRVIVMLKDLQGNYYEPMYFEVPNYFEEE